MSQPRTLAPIVPDLEMSVLGACLVNAKAAALAAARLRPSDFFDDTRRLTFATIQRLVQAGTPIDRVTVKTAEPGIPATSLLDLEEAVPSAVNAAHYIEQVRTCGRSRERLQAAKHLVEHLSSNGTDADAHIQDFLELAGYPGDTPNGSAPALPALDAPVAVLRGMHEQGDPIPTGLAVLDDRLRGGMRRGKALVIGGTAGAGKTALGLQIGRTMAEAGCAVACLMADEGREPAVIRLGQQLGWERAQIEDGLEGALAGIAQVLERAVLLFPDPDADADVTVEGVAEALVRAHPERQGVLFVDSIQTVRTRRGATGLPSLRERIMENARTARRMALEHNLVVLYTSEVNRSWYRARKEEDRASDLAAFAEARIEFSADVLLTMRSLDDDPDLVEVRIPKNRLGARSGFLLRLNRERARFTEVDGDPRQDVQDVALTRRAEEATATLLRALTEHPGLTRGQLQEIVAVKGEIFVKALHSVKTSGIVRVEPEGRAMRHFLTEVPK